jgi:hypothetical protein
MKQCMVGVLVVGLFDGLFGYTYLIIWLSDNLWCRVEYVSYWR